MLKKGDEIELKAIKTINGESNSPDNEVIRFSNTIKKTVIGEKSAVLTANVSDDPSLENAKSLVIQGIQSVMCVPLWNNENVYGLIYLDSPFHEHAFNEENLQLLVAVANLITMKIENYLYVQELLEKKSLEKELEIASDVQNFLLPSGTPEIKGFDIHSFYKSCLKLGGDYYNCFPLNNKNLIVIADVMGKGAGAALLTASLHSVLLTFSKVFKNIDELVRKVNASICNICKGEIFITLFAMLIEEESPIIRYCNAGHNEALVVRASGSNEWLSKGGTLLGFIPDASYEYGKTELDENDIMILYTDGVTDATDPAENMFGKELLLKTLEENKELSSADIARKLVRTLEDFTSEASQHDDITGVIIKRLFGKKHVDK